VFFSACSSAPLDDAATGETEPSPSASAGSAPVAAPGSSTSNYQKRDYPPGPYGTGIGATLEDFAFLGWHDPVAAAYDQTKLEQVRLSEYYDPEGSSGSKLLWINASAVWCSVCRSEMQDIKNNNVRAEFAPKGVQLMVTLFEDSRSGPAKPLDLHNWGSIPAHAIDFPLVLDPSFKLGTFFTSDATPLNMLVDVRTMKVISLTMGYSADYWSQVDKYLATL
jgi:hypothetical protein